MIPRSLYSACRIKPHSTTIQFRSRHSSRVPPSSGSSSSSSLDFANLNPLTYKDWLAPNEVLKIFTHLRDPNSVITVFNQVAQRRDYKPNEPLFTLIINKLGKAKKFDQIEELMSRIRAEKGCCRLSDEFFFNVIKIYGNVAGRINRAIETLFDMPNFHCWPSVKTFNFVLNLLVSTKQFEIVHKTYLGASQLGIEIDACSLNILIKGLCGCGDLDAALYVLDEFPKQKQMPNAKTFSTLMHGLCENGKLEEAFGLLGRMEGEGIEPDTITFNILISGLRKHGRVEEGKELLNKMKLKGCEPNQGSYQEVLYGLLDAQNFAEAKDLMRRMIVIGFEPSFVSYRSMIHGLCERTLLEDVDWVVRQMVVQGFIPQMGMWRHIIQSMSMETVDCSAIFHREIAEG